MTETMDAFVRHFQTKIRFNKDLILKSQNRYFLLNQELKGFIAKDFYYAGVYLGKDKSGRFYSSFNLLEMIAKKDSNKVIVNKKTEWLFVCGRDIFRKGILRLIGPNKRNYYTLVLNQYNECLGFGKIVSEVAGEEEGIFVKNILDLGDFLRREK